MNRTYDEGCHYEAQVVAVVAAAAARRLGVDEIGQVAGVIPKQ